MDSLRRYKPHGSTYLDAARQVGVAPSQAALVTAHGWDIADAQAAGLATGFIARAGQELYPLTAPPVYQGKTLVEVARQMIG